MFLFRKRQPALIAAAAVAALAPSPVLAAQPRIETAPSPGTLAPAPLRPALALRRAAAARAPIELGVASLEAALAQGASLDAALRRAVEAMAYADFTPLDLNGPHTKAGERINRKKQAGARAVMLRMVAS